DLDATAAWGVVVRLGRVEVRVPELVLAGLLGKRLAVERADQVLPVRRVQDPFPSLTAADRQLEQVRALEEVVDGAPVRPRLEVRGGVERDPPLPISLVVDGHDPVLAGPVPDEL